MMLVRNLSTLGQAATVSGNIPWNKGLKTGAQCEEVKKRTSEAVKKWWKLRKENAINTNMQSKEN